MEELNGCKTYGLKRIYWQYQNTMLNLYRSEGRDYYG